MLRQLLTLKWFFSDSRGLRYRVVQEGDLAICRVSIGRAEGWKKECRLVFAFLGVNQQTSTYTRNQTDGSDSNQHSWERLSLICSIREFWNG